MSQATTANAPQLPPQVMGKLAKELKDIVEKPVEGIKFILNEENMTDIRADISGPVGTPFEGGVFRVKIILPAEYPTAPPKGNFLTKIFHPNVSKTGEICVNTLKRDWKPDHGIKHIFQVIRCLLIIPFPESALNEEAGKLMQDYPEYERRARLMTSIHAMPAEENVETANSKNNASGDGVKSEKKRSGKDKPDRKKQDKKRSLKRL
eukprot:TRINITY_DN3695_c0_g2_i5.p1 TRINITY_DN3695_c0_g2~~TRINITY_DN3695_c0_g2_i5.p1  ORF type:complete len:228 (-),score=46.33 TRINITY_DN3695_c0_g2_i5:495-1115(-)